MVAFNVFAPSHNDGPGVIITDHRDLFLEGLQSGLDAYERDTRKDRVPTFKENIFGDTYHEPTIRSGRQRFDNFEELLANGFVTKWQTHKFQQEVQEIAKQVLARQILGSDYQEVITVLAEDRHWDLTQRSQMLLCVGPRRIGKTVTIAMLAAAFALAVPGKKQSIFSTAQRISRNLGETIRDAIVAAGAGDRIDTFGEEKMKIRGDIPGEYSTVYYFPANAKIS